MAIAAYLTALNSSPDGATFTAVPGVTDFSIDPVVAELKSTALGGSGHEAAIAGLFQFSAKVSFDYVNGNVGQQNLAGGGGTVAAPSAPEGSRCDIQAFYSDGTEIAFRGIVESYEFSIDASGKVSVVTTLKSTDAVPVETTSGAVTPAPTAAAAIAGYNLVVSVTGTTTPFSAEATTNVTGNTYQITNTAKRFWDPTVAPTFKGNGVAIPAAQIQSLNPLFGTVTFTQAETSPVTVDTGSYLPLLAVTESKNAKINVKNRLINKTSGDSNGVESWLKGLGYASGSFTTLQTLIAQTGGAGPRLLDQILNRTKIGVQINFGTGNVFKTWCWLSKDSSKWKPENAAEQTVNFSSTDQGVATQAYNYAWGS